MSASLDTGDFSRYFAQRSAELKIAGRTHPVDIIYTQFFMSNFGKCEAEDYWAMAVNKVAEVHQREREGDRICTASTSWTRHRPSCCPNRLQCSRTWRHSMVRMLRIR